MKIGLIAAAIAVCATAASAQTLTVEGEEGVTYTVIALESGVSITTHREEGNNSLFSKHAVSCEPYLAGLLGSGPTLDAMNGSLKTDVEFAEIVRFSSEDIIAGYACAN